MRLPRVSPGSYNQFGSSGSFQHVKELPLMFFALKVQVTVMRFRESFCQPQQGRRAPGMVARARGVDFGVEGSADDTTLRL
jgi:hypothetical protein